MEEGVYARAKPLIQESRTKRERGAWGPSSVTQGRLPWPDFAKVPLLPSDTNSRTKLLDLVWVPGDMLDPSYDRKQHRMLEQLEGGEESSSPLSADEFIPKN